ncbi:hypothetical protein [Variovorax sp. UMC13]|uniref:hypothetical protein n=1 Tax=Variovorax sp. UMC13 TaxID=1862326 RepID=UPI001603A872|nr:hypothetical protein [Variovorax sp. UMC13]
MSKLTNEELLSRLDEWLIKNPPARAASMALLKHKSTISSLHHEGYSKATIFRFLTEAGAVKCHHATFYRWFNQHIDI